MPRRRWGKEAGRGYEAGFIPVGMVAPCQDQEGALGLCISSLGNLGC